MLYSHGTLPYRDFSTAYSQAYFSKLGELLAAGCHVGEAHWQARQHALEMQGREISAEDAAYNAQVVAALGVAYGTPAAPVSLPLEPTNEDGGAFDWDAVFGKANRNR